MGFVTVLLHLLFSVCFIVYLQYKNKLGKEACANNDKIRGRESFGEKAPFYNCQGLDFVDAVLAWTVDSRSQSFTSQNTINIILVFC